MTSNDSVMCIPLGKIISSNQLSFRRTLLFYLKTNANPRLSLKLMQISPYFCFKEFPFQIVEDLKYKNGELKYLRHGQSEYRTLDLDNLTKPVWITDALIFCVGENPISNLLSKIAVCDVKKLNIGEQNLNFDEFKFLISSNGVEIFYFYRSQIFYDDGSIVPVDEVVKFLPNLKKFEWSVLDPVYYQITPASTQKLIEYFNPSFLTNCSLFQIPETFDFKLFSEFMDQNPSIRFILFFKSGLSDEYAKFLQHYVDKLIRTGEYRNRKILIIFPQQNLEFFSILNKHFNIK